MKAQNQSQSTTWWNEETDVKERVLRVGIGLPLVVVLLLGYVFAINQPVNGFNQIFGIYGICFALLMFAFTAYFLTISIFNFYKKEIRISIGILTILLLGMLIISSPIIFFKSMGLLIIGFILFTIVLYFIKGLFTGLTLSLWIVCTFPLAILFNIISINWHLKIEFELILYVTFLIAIIIYQCFGLRLNNFLISKMYSKDTEINQEHFKNQMRLFGFILYILSTILKFSTDASIYSVMNESYITYIAIIEIPWGQLFLNQKNNSDPSYMALTEVDS